MYVGLVQGLVIGSTMISLGVYWLLFLLPKDSTRCLSKGSLADRLFELQQKDTGIDPHVHRLPVCSISQYLNSRSPNGEKHLLNDSMLITVTTAW